MAYKILSKTQEDILCLVYRPQIEALEQTCRELGCSTILYSLFTPSEGKLCVLLNEDSEDWTVCSFERGYGHGEERYSSFQKACIRLVQRLSRTSESRDASETCYLNNMLAQAKTDTPTSCVSSVLKRIASSAALM